MAVAAFVVAGAAPSFGEEERIAFPENYRTEFSNYLNLGRTQNPDQIIHLYANEAAQAGPSDDGAFADGSILVGEIYAARKDADGNVIESSLGQRLRGNLAAIAVMEKREGWGADIPEELRNGDWDFAIFSPAGERLDRDLNACRACHAPLTDTDFVFSNEHLVR
jgi:hypothetical protein